MPQRRLISCERLSLVFSDGDLLREMLVMRVGFKCLGSCRVSLPTSIPDYLALVGDAADGYPGLRGWGAKSTAAVLSRYGKLEAIPPNSADWGVAVTSPRGLAETLKDQWKQALLFRDLATLRTDIELFQSVEDLQWKGPMAAFPVLAAKLDHFLRQGK